MKLELTKELFIESMEALKKQYEHKSKSNIALQSVFPDAEMIYYPTHWVDNALVMLLQKATKDDHAHSWIEYFMDELNFGEAFEDGMVKIGGKNFTLKTPSDLWDLLNLEKGKN